MDALPRPFPSLLIRADGLEGHGSFAENQQRYFDPDSATLAELDELLKRRNAGIVAHFYMDAELQGVLCHATSPHVHISDSLQMSDRAVAMADAGIGTIVVLGVDFMAENVRAMLDASGHSRVAVYRVAATPIGCSLAESAEGPAYRAYLEKAASRGHALHVVYINTSLQTKAWAHQVVPTITCTSSNVVGTVLSAFAHDPELELWFGPDTYMGRNLHTLFGRVSAMSEARVAEIHGAHTPESVARLVRHFHYFEQGTCIVHEMFGARVVDRVKSDYSDAHVVAHLEVPGEMFALGLEAQLAGRGVVGSTSDILGYIGKEVARSLRSSERSNPTFVLGTESGMITSIVEAVRALLRRADDPDATAEIVFPVSDDAIVPTGDPGLPLVPGVAQTEGCSVSGGCATCPYMKMNSLDALIDLLRREGVAQLDAFRPRQYSERIAGRSLAEVGSQPILHMRAFQDSGRLPEALMCRVASLPKRD